MTNAPYLLPQARKGYRLGNAQIVDSMITQRVDAICLAPIDKTAMVSVVDRATREKIPVIIFDSPVDTQNFVAQVASNVSSKELQQATGPNVDAADAMVEQLNPTQRAELVRLLTVRMQGGE